MPRCKVCNQEMEYMGEPDNLDLMYVCFNKECGINETEALL